MGLLCSKCSRLKWFEAGKAAESSQQPQDPANGTIEIRNCTEKATHFGSKFTRRKVAKKRPVISTPRPVNPKHLNGRKWKHVIVTIPSIDEPPVRPVRKKRKSGLSKGDTSDVGLVYSHPNDTVGSKKMSFFEIMSVLQLRRCLRVLDAGFEDSLTAEAEHEVDERARRPPPDDLYFTFLRGTGNDEAAIMVFAFTSPSPPFIRNIDYTKNRSLTNEPNDSFFDNANVCGCAGYRFKKNFILLPTSPDRQPASKRDLDKLKFYEICQPRAPSQNRCTSRNGGGNSSSSSSGINANCIEIRASRDNNAKNESPPSCSCPSYAFVTRRNINRRVVSITSSSTSSPPLHQSNSLNAKNISNKTNQKPNNMYSSSSTNIEKVSNKMKKIQDENVSLPAPHPAPTRIALPSPSCNPENHLTSASAILCAFTQSPGHNSNTMADDVARLNSDCCMKNCIQDDDRDSDTSCTDSLTEFTFSLGT